MKKLSCTSLLLILFITTEAMAQMVPFSFMKVHEVVSNLRTVSTLLGRDIFVGRTSAGCGSGSVVPQVFQAFRVSSTGMYSILATQTADGYLTLLKDYADVSNLLASCVMANDDYPDTNHSYLAALLQANTDYYIVSANYSGTGQITFNTKITGPGTVTETSPTLTNTAASMVGNSGDYIYLTGIAKPDASAIGIYNDRYCINKVNSGPEDLVTFNTTGLKTLLGPGTNTFYGRVTDPTGPLACTPIGQQVGSCGAPAPPTNLSPLTLTTGVFYQAQTYTWDMPGYSCESLSSEYSVGTSSGAIDVQGWTTSGSASIFPFYSPGTYYVNVRTKNQSGSAVSSVVTATLNTAPSASFTGNIDDSDPTFVRPNQGNPTMSSSGNITKYEVRSFTVDTSGTYNIGTRFGWDGYLVLYENSFDPSQPLVNAVIANDDYNGIAFSFFSTNLTAGVTYYLVNTQFGTGVGPYVSLITGPGVVTVNP